jgi:menaquinone-specific isochorismate synthase
MTLPITDLKKALLFFLNNLKPADLTGNNLISFAYKLEQTDLTPLIDPILQENNKLFYLNRPEENLVILAFEEAFSSKIIVSNKLTAMEDMISGIAGTLICNYYKESIDPFPMFMGGTKFCSGKKSGEWDDFRDNDWFIPRFLFYLKNNKYWLVINFYIDKMSTSESQVNDLFESLDKLNNDHPVSKNNLPEIKIRVIENEKENWNKLVSDALGRIEEGFFRKVVLSRRIIAEIKKSPLFSRVLSDLRENYKNCTVFLYKSGNSILFGATPEQLLKFNKNELEFDALAGSAKRGMTDEEDKIIAGNLINDKKNIQEHNHVIDFIKEASSTYVKNFRQFDTGIKKFSNIQHIYTPIKAELNSEAYIFNLVDEIYPTPAICGSPKESSLNYIIKNEEFDRGLFSGIIGFISPGKMDLVIAIRSALLKDNILYIYAGCGIVKGSDPVSEFEETEIKMYPILSLFTNAN